MKKALLVVGLLLAASGARAQEDLSALTTGTTQPGATTDSSAAPAGGSPSTIATSSSSSTMSSAGTVERPFEVQPSRHELSVQMGYAAAFGGNMGSPSGLKISGDYAYKFHRIAWFDLQLGNTFGFGGKDGRCVGSFDSECYRGGWDFEIAAGARLKFVTPRLPQLLIEVPLLVGVDVLYNRNCGDNGAAVVLRPGVRAQYFLTPRVGVGIAMNAAFGPGFHGAGDPVCTSNTYTDFYGAFDFLAGAEFLL
jgi:hypothetical protein